MVAALSGDLFAQLDVEVRVVDRNDNPIQVIDDNVRFSVREDEDAGMLFAFYTIIIVFFPTLVSWTCQPGE